MKSAYRSIRTTREALSDQTAQQIQALIMSGELHPGDQLPPERELSEYLGVSRTVVREAIKLLDAMGLVRVRHGVGAFVVKPGPDTLSAPLGLVAGLGQRAVEDLGQVREVLEPEIAALAAEHATGEDIAKLEEALKKMDEDLTDARRYIEADLAFHSALAQATQNSLFQLLVHSVVDVMQQVRRLVAQSPGAVERAQVHHRNILKAVKNGKANKAREAMRQHLEQIKREIEVGMATEVGKG